MPSRSAFLASAVALAATTATAAGGLLLGTADAATTASVQIKGIDFHPHTLKVHRGTTVTWSFDDEATPHNVTSRGSTKFKSSPTKQSGHYSVRFAKAGTYRYVCTIHFNMKAKIVVS